MSTPRLSWKPRAVRWRERAMIWTYDVNRGLEVLVGGNQIILVDGFAVIVSRFGCKPSLARSR
jgi:hypothetical protein